MKWHLSTFALLVTLSLGCTSDEASEAKGDLGLDTSPPSDDGTIPDAGWMSPQRSECQTNYELAPDEANPGYTALIEVSGIGASLRRTDLLWMHNDSGGQSVLYSVGRDGRRRGRLTVPGEALDWEDLSAARCPDGSGPCLWVADVGDNGLVRDHVEVIAVREPAEDGDHTAERVWRYPVQYPGGPINSEALLVAPRGDRFWLIEKVDAEKARIYGHAGPLVDGQMETLQLTSTIQSPGIAVERGRMVTAADLHPNGSRLLIRTYTGSFEYLLLSALDLSSLSEVMPRTVAFGPVSEPQGEAIAYDEAGTGVWTISEDPSGEQVQPLHHYGCAD